MQYDICRNLDKASRARVPYLVVLQSDLLSPLETVVVAPVLVDGISNAITKLNPIVIIGGKPCRVSIQDLAGVPRKRLGPVVANADRQHGEFVAAIDLLFTGI